MPVLITGSGYIVLFVLGVFANFIVRNGLVDPNNASAPARTLQTRTVGR
jgi:hypothetical protein